MHALALTEAIVNPLQIQARCAIKRIVQGHSLCCYGQQR